MLAIVTVLCMTPQSVVSTETGAAGRVVRVEEFAPKEEQENDGFTLEERSDSRRRPSAPPPGATSATRQTGSTRESHMTTRDTIQQYFTSLKRKSGWEPLLSDELVFTSFTAPVKHISGRAAYLEATRRFYSMITAVEVRELMVEGSRACALTRYELQPPGGPAFTSDVAEVFDVREGKITSFDIYFDSVPFPK